MRGLPAILAAALAASAPLGASPADPAPAANEAAVRTIEFLSDVYTVDRKYRSMLGPQSTQTIYLLDKGADEELLWVTGFRAVMVGADGKAPISQEFMCHSNLDMNMKLHKRLLGLDREAPDRVFTLSQGQQEVTFPAGFGMPVLSTEPFRLTTQVLNLNVEGETFQVRHRVTVTFVRDRDLTTSMKPLMQVVANGLVLIDGKDPYYNVAQPDPNTHGTGCLVGLSAVSADHLVADQQGRRFSGHWVVGPGRQENHTNVTRYMDLPFDTTIHYIAVHLHPFAESLELRDLTTDTTVYKSLARGVDGKIGLSRVDYFSSPEGVALFKSHEYELISVYDNTSSQDQDSMAVMYMYALDPEFKNPLAPAVNGGAPAGH